MGLPATKPTLSPMMLRYLEYKEQYPDALLFFQVGDFYELFYDDAITVAKSLNLTLTSRDKNSADPIPMCGVPISVLDGYVDRLLPMGYSVAVVSQAGSGAGVDRKLERFVTPGMRLFNSVVSDSQESLIAAVVLESDGRGAALVATDPQTGTMRVKEDVDIANIPREISAWMAREVLLPRQLFGERLDRRLSWIRAVEGVVGEQALRFRSEAFGTHESDRLLQDGARHEFHALSPTAKRCVRLLLSYIDEITLGNPLPIKELGLDRGGGCVAIDAATRRNLELVQNMRDGTASGTLFNFLNTTETPGGARLLRSWLLAPLADVSEIFARQQGVRELLYICLEVRALLSGLGDLERLAARVQLRVASPKDLGAIRDALERVPKVINTIPKAASSLVQRIANELVSPEELTEVLCAALVDSPPHTTQDGGVIRDGFDGELDAIKRLRSDADAWRADFETRERHATGISSLKVRSNGVIGFFVEVPTSQGAKVPSHYQRRQSTANAERFVTPELKQHEEAVVTAVDRQVRREQALFGDLRSRVMLHVEDLRRISGALARLDALTALALTATNNQWVAPVVVEEPILDIQHGRHPIIEKLLGGSFIPNSVSFGAPEPICFVVTGPNMGGKSTYLRQTAIITILAQIGSYVPAQSATIGVVDRVFARLGSADDLHEGESTFMVEMREAAHILANATARSLVLIDELGRGTATTDGQSLAQAILERLAFETGCRTLFATHYHQITALADDSARLGNLSVGSVEEEDRVVFTHAIQKGPAPRSYGLEVAKLSGLPDAVIERAGEILRSGTTVEPQRVATPSSERQQHLFSPSPVIKKDPVLEKIRESLERLDVDSLSPRDALNTLYDLKRQSLGK
jgi:DNA mismatch repair protein MutS